MDHESVGVTNCDWCFWHSDWMIIKGPGGFGSWRTDRDHPNDSIIDDGQNTEKSPGDLRSLDVTQTPVKNSKRVNNNNNNIVKANIIMNSRLVKQKIGIKGIQEQVWLGGKGDIR